jgi:hypothetical protein
VSRVNWNRLAHRYDLLSPRERLRAALEAEARGDSEERARLVGSCPMSAAWISDPAFSDRLDASRDGPDQAASTPSSASA